MSARRLKEFVFRGKKLGPIGNSITRPAPTVPIEARQVPEDQELIRQVGRGDPAAFRALVDQHGRYLYGVAFGLTGHAADAEDLVQETFAGALKGRFRGESSLRTWLVGILVRQASQLRRSRRRRVRPASLDDPAVHARVGGTAATARGAEARLDLATMLESLSAEHRAVVVLREIEGQSYEEMARTLGVPVGTVESRLHRAREELRRRFKAYL
ncbi:MAG: DNA-directed RNA polymerase sigma-70 factor [Phycisphaerae bacterium]